MILNRDSPQHIGVVSVAGVFASLATIISVTHVIQHLRHFHCPQQQKYIIRILLMVPIYAIDSWISLEFRHLNVYFSTFRECYEGYVLWAFMSLLISFLGGTEELVPKLEKMPKSKVLLPLCCIKFQPGRKFLYMCKRGILNYSVVRPITGITALCLEVFGVYNDGKFHLNSGYTWLTIINNCSVSLAMFSLVNFYKVCKHELDGYRPVAKFMCIKGVLFFSFWQGVIIALLVKFGIIRELGSWDIHDVSVGIQNFLICIEMFFFACFHFYSFTHKTYKDMKPKDDVDDVANRDSTAVVDVADEFDEPVEGAAPSSGLPLVPTDLCERGQLQMDASDNFIVQSGSSIDLEGVVIMNDSGNNNNNDDDDTKSMTRSTTTNNNSTVTSSKHVVRRKLETIGKHVKNVGHAVLPTDFVVDTIETISFKEFRTGSRTFTTVALSLETVPAASGSSTTTTTTTITTVQTSEEEGGGANLPASSTDFIVFAEAAGGNDDDNANLIDILKMKA